VTTDADGVMSVTFEPDLPKRLLAYDVTRELAGHGLIELAETLYYLAWSRGYNPELAKFYARPVHVLLLLALPRGGRTVLAAGHFASWLRQTGRDEMARPIVQQLEQQLYNDPNGEFAGWLANLMTSGLGELGTRERIEHLTWATQQVDEPDPLVRLGWLSALTAGEASYERIVGHYELVVRAVEEAAAHLEASGVDKVRLATARTQFFKTIIPLVSALLESGDTGRAAELIAIWCGVPQNARPEGDVLFVYDSAQGVRFASGGGATVTTSSRGRTRFTIAANQALGKALVDVSDTASPHQRATGRLDRSHAAEFADAAAEYLGLAELSTALSGATQSAGQERILVAPPLISLLNGHLPLQGLLARRGTAVPPLLASMARPLRDRHVASVQFWNGDAPGSDEEFALLESVLISARVDRIETPDVTRERFLAEYERDEYDVIWIASHADRDRYDPQDAGLTLRDGERVSLEDVVGLQRVPGPRRRLLVLNGCSSGATSDFGPLSLLGLAHQLAGPDQAVVANLWPVNDIPARLFAGLLAAGLVQYTGYDEAFAYAMRSFTGPDHALSREIENWDSAGRFSDVLHEYQERSALAWGAPAYYV
jgi:hypothetical protein